MKDLENIDNNLLDKELLSRRKISFLYKRLEDINRIHIKDTNYLATSDRYISIIESLAISLLTIPWDRDAKSREITRASSIIHMDYFINNDYLDFIHSRKINPWIGKPGTLLGELLLMDNLNSYLSIHQMLDKCVTQALIRNNLQWFINRKLDEAIEDELYTNIEIRLQVLTNQSRFIKRLSQWTQSINSLDTSNKSSELDVILQDIKLILYRNGYQYIEEVESESILFLDHSYNLGQLISELIDKRRSISLGFNQPSNTKEEAIMFFLEIVSPSMDRLIVQKIVDEVKSFFLPGGIDYYLVVMSALYLSRALSLSIYTSDIKNIKFNLYLAGYLLRKSNIRSLNILGNNCCYSSSLKDKEPIRIPL
jgi:hypothetical protein